MKKIFFLLFLLASALIINSLIRSIWNLGQKQDLISLAQKELEKKKGENQRLKDKLSEVQKAQFVEEEARNKLFMAKPGEIQLIIPKNLLVASESGKEKPDKRPNWKKWWDLFF